LSNYKTFAIRQQWPIPPILTLGASHFISTYLVSYFSCLLFACFLQEAASLPSRQLNLWIEIWSHGDIHTTDIEFGRLFAKFIETSRSDGEKPTTQDILRLHETLLDAVETAKANGFTKDDPAEKIAPGIRDINFKANHQIEYFNIKPLCRGLIIIIENPTEQRKSHFEQQLVRLIQTGWTAGLSQPINFQSLEVQEVIADNEVIVLLPEAVRFTWIWIRRKKRYK